MSHCWGCKANWATAWGHDERERKRTEKSRREEREKGEGGREAGEEGGRKEDMLASPLLSGGASCSIMPPPCPSAYRLLPSCWTDSNLEAGLDSFSSTSCCAIPITCKFCLKLGFPSCFTSTSPGPPCPGKTRGPANRGEGGAGTTGWGPHR